MENNQFLRTLWQNHIAEEQIWMDEEEKAIMRNVTAVEEELRRDMTETQRKLLEIYNDHVAELHAAGLSRAFEKGVVFSARYARAVFEE